MIKKQGDKWVILNHDGTKTLGTYPTQATAKKRLQQIEFFKNTRDYFKSPKKEAKSK